MNVDSDKNGAQPMSEHDAARASTSVGTAPLLMDYTRSIEDVTVPIETATLADVTKEPRPQDDAS